MLQLQKGKYTTQDLINLEYALGMASKAFECNAPTCSCCEYNRPCNDILRCRRYVRSLLDIEAKN